MSEASKDRLNREELAAIIRRAAELQDESVKTLTRSDVVRIARELALEPVHVEQAIEEARARRAGRDPYQLAAWVVLVLGFVLVSLAIGRNLFG